MDRYDEIVNHIIIAVLHNYSDRTTGKTHGYVRQRLQDAEQHGYGRALADMRAALVPLLAAGAWQDTQLEQEYRDSSVYVRAAIAEGWHEAIRVAMDRIEKTEHKPDG